MDPTMQVLPVCPIFRWQRWDPYSLCDRLLSQQYMPRIQHHLYFHSPLRHRLNYKRRCHLPIQGADIDRANTGLETGTQRTLIEPRLGKVLVASRHVHLIATFCMCKDLKYMFLIVVFGSVHQNEQKDSKGNLFLEERDIKQ